MAELTRREVVPEALTAIPASAQLLAVAWLRWRIFVNSVFRKRPKNRRQIAGLVFNVVLRLITWPAMALMAIGPVVGSGFLAWALISEGHRHSLAPLLLGISLLWQFVSVNGLSIAATAPSFDPASLVRFPLRFGRYFVLRSLLGLLTPSTIIGSLALLAAAVGIGVADSSLALPALAALTIYALMNIYLTRMIDAWMERWLANRRFREFFSILMALFAVGFQFLNLRQVPEHAHGEDGSWLMSLMHSSGSYLDWLPPGFAAQAILLVRHPLQAAANFAGLLAVTVLFAAVFAIRLKKQFLGEYLSEGVSWRASSQSAARLKRPARQPAAFSVPETAGALISPVVAACLRKDWLILRSNGAQLIGLLMPPMFLAIFSMNQSIFGISSRYMLPAAIAYASATVLSSLYNVFGADGSGAQLYLLAPIHIRDVVVAKNLMSLALIGAEVGAAWAIVCALSRTSISLSAQVSTALWTIFLVAANLTIGTLRSIQAPRRFVPGQGRALRATPNNRSSALLALAMLFGSVMPLVPVGMASHYFGKPWLGAFVFGPLAAVAVAAYALLLKNAERLILAYRDEFAAELCKA
jgi:ABC-2 type transport system permease protein